MGQKVNPIGFRLKINKDWDSRWFAGKSYQETLLQDLEIRKYLEKRLKSAYISKIVIERPANKPIVNLYSGRPGLIIGKKGTDIELLRKDLAKFLGRDVQINIVEIRKPEIEAKLVAQNVASQLEKRVAFRRAMRRVVQSALRFGAEGIRINCSGRLGGAEIARMEWYREGRVPLHTLRADIDYGEAEALTTYGVIGIKVWIYKGEILKDGEREDLRSAA
jgi:small subunit ribosomal protein S3